VIVLATDHWSCLEYAIKESSCRVAGVRRCRISMFRPLASGKASGSTADHRLAPKSTNDARTER
jgi:hypothetical protein